MMKFRFHSSLSINLKSKRKRNLFWNADGTHSSKRLRGSDCWVDPNRPSLSSRKRQPLFLTTCSVLDEPSTTTHVLALHRKPPGLKSTDIWARISRVCLTQDSLDRRKWKSSCWAPHSKWRKYHYEVVFYILSY